MLLLSLSRARTLSLSVCVCRRKQHFVPVQPLASWLQAIGLWEPPYASTRMPAQEYFDNHHGHTTRGQHGQHGQHGQQTEGFAYFSADVNLQQLRQDQYEALQEIMPPLDDILHHDSELLQTAEAHVWLGSPRVVSPLHFDMSHNIYVQMSGQKKFTMFLNDEDLHQRIPLYPMTHPSLRKSPVNMTGGFPQARAKFPSLQGMRRVCTAMLNPGDIMVMPLDTYVCMQQSCAVNLVVRACVVDAANPGAGSLVTILCASGVFICKQLSSRGNPRRRLGLSQLVDAPQTDPCPARDV